MCIYSNFGFMGMFIIVLCNLKLEAGLDVRKIE